MQDVRTVLESEYGIQRGNAVGDAPIFNMGICAGATTLTEAQLETLLLTVPAALYGTVTAFATGGQSSATAITKRFTNVSVCATAFDSVKLPAAAQGTVITVLNTGAATCSIFPASGDSINAMAVNLSVDLPPLCQITFFAKDGTVWYTDPQKGIYLPAPSTQKGGVHFKAGDMSGNTILTYTNAQMGQATVITTPDPGAATANLVLSEGAQTINGALSLTALLTLTGLLKMKITSGITAATTQTQAAATVLASNINHVATCANANDGVALPAAAAGLFVLIKNAGANTLKIWPSNGASDKINDGTTDAGITLATTKSALFYAIDSTNWSSIALD